MTLLTVEEIDEALAKLGTQRILRMDKLPESIDTTGMRTITEKIHKGSLMGNKEGVIVYVEAVAVIDKLLDMRNEIEPPIRTIPQERTS